MCDPLSLAVSQFALGATAAVTGYIGQQRMADANESSARQAAITTYAYQQNRISQERAAAVGQKTEEAIETMKARSTAAAAAGEAGVVGLSVDHLLNDYAGRQGRYNDAVGQNFQMQRDYLVGEMEATRARAQNQINSVPRPSLIDTGLRIASSGVSAAGDFFKMKNIDRYRPRA